MIELGLEAGLRVSEMASLKHCSLYIDEFRSSIVVIGKGSKIRPVWISSEFKKKCLEYIRYKTEFGFNIYNDSYFLNNLRDTKISKRALQKFFKQIIIKSGLPIRYHIHCLRHTYSTLYETEDIPLECKRIYLHFIIFGSDWFIVSCLSSDGVESPDEI